MKLIKLLLILLINSLLFFVRSLVSLSLIASPSWSSSCATTPAEHSVKTNRSEKSFFAASQLTGGRLVNTGIIILLVSVHLHKKEINYVVTIYLHNDTHGLLFRYGGWSTGNPTCGRVLLKYLMQLNCWLIRVMVTLFYTHFDGRWRRFWWEKGRKRFHGVRSSLFTQLGRVVCWWKHELAWPLGINVVGACRGLSSYFAISSPSSLRGVHSGQH